MLNSNKINKKDFKIQEINQYTKLLSKFLKLLINGTKLKICNTRIIEND